MEATTGGGRPVRRDARRLARHQVMGLVAQFVLGMVVAALGQPSETTGGAHTASTVFLGLHILLGLALVAGAVMVIMAARAIEGRRRMLAHWGALAVVAAFAAGVITMVTNSSAWSYAMAAAFAASLVLYLVLVIAAPSPAQQAE